MNELDLKILKTILSNRRYALEFAHECSEKIFHQDLWRFARIILDYLRIYRELPTERIIIEKTKSSKNESLLKYVMEVFGNINATIYDEKEFKYDLEKLKHRYSEHLLSNLKDNLNSENGFDLKKNVSDIQNTLSGIKSVHQQKIYKDGSFIDYAKDFRELYMARQANPDFGLGIKTGYTFIDYAIGGLKNGTLLLFAGITAAGKSLLLMNTCIQIWLGENTTDMTEHFKKGYNVLLFSLEMNYEDYFQRSLARLSFVPQRSIRDATLNDDEKKRINEAFKFVKQYPYQFRIIDLPRKATAETINLIIDEQAEKGFKPDVVAIDYLNLMGADINGEQQDWLLQTAISESVHEMARTREIPILSAIQLNPKSVGTKGEDAGEFGVKSFRRATGIGDNSDYIIAINTRKDEKNYPDLSCSFIKNRSGELSSGKLHKEMTCCAILDKKIDPESSDSEDISSLISQS
jgi:replicative DNA helicase